MFYHVKCEIRFNMRLADWWSHMSSFGIDDLNLKLSFLTLYFFQITKSI